MKWRKIGLAALLATAVLAGAQGAISVRSTVDRSTILIGDVIRYSVIVEHDPEIELVTPSLAANLGQFEIRDYHVLDPVERDGRILSQTDYLISTFDTGEFQIPPLEIGYTVRGDSTMRTISTEPIPVLVESLNPDEAGDIRDIKPPLEPARNWRAVVRLASLVVLGAALAGFLIFWLRRRRRGEALLPKRRQPPRPAHEVALAALKELVEGDDLRQGRIKPFYSRLSEIVRSYIEDRFHLPALEMTTPQLLSAMRAERLPEEHCRILSEFLDLCDLVKFAKYRPANEETDATVALAFEFVERTQMVFQPAAEVVHGQVEVG